MYVSDIIEFMSKKTDKKELLFNCNVEFEISSKEEYDKNPEKYNSMIADAFIEAKDAHVTDREMKTILSAKGKVYFTSEKKESEAAVVKESEEETEENDIRKSVIYFTSDQDEQHLYLYLNFDKDKYYQLNSAIKNETYSDIDLKDFNIGIEIQNDMNEPCSITVNTAYVNNEPVLHNKLFVIDKRDSIAISIPGIFKDYTFQNGRECILKILKQKKKEESKVIQ